MQTILCFSGEGRGWESPSEAAAGHWFPSGQGGMTHLLSLCCCSEHPTAQGPALLRAAHVLNFGREGGGEVSLLFVFLWCSWLMQFTVTVSGELGILHAAG